MPAALRSALPRGSLADLLGLATHRAGTPALITYVWLAPYVWAATAALAAAAVIVARFVHLVRGPHARRRSFGPSSAVEGGGGPGAAGGGVQGYGERPAVGHLDLK